jgi:O-antigen/teichoic acid export membrane protein
VLKNGFYNTLGGILRIVLGLISVPILIRIIGIDNYGLWTLASSVIGIIALAEGGISVSTTFFLSQDIANKDKKGISETLTITFASILVLATIGAILMYVSSESITSFFPKLSNAEHKQILITFKVGSIVLWTRLIQQNFIGIIQAYEQYGLLNLLTTIQVSLNSLGLIVVTLLGGRTIEMMEWQILLSFGTLFAYLWLSRKAIGHTKSHFRWNRPKAISIFRYSTIAWAGNLGSALFAQSDRLIVGAVLDVKSLGLYAAITNVVNQINSISALPVSPLLPSIAKMHKDKSMNDKKRIIQLKQGVELNAFIALGMGSFIVSMADVILSVLAGKDFNSSSILAMQIAAIIYSLYSLNAVGFYILYGTGKIKICTYIHLASAILSVLLISILSKRFYLLGAVTGNSAYIFTILMTVLGLYELNIPRKELIRWLTFPFCWFVASVTLSLYFQSFDIYLRSIIYILEITLLFLVFLKSNSIKIKDMLKFSK